MRVVRLVLGTTLLFGPQQASARVVVVPFDVSAVQGSGGLGADAGQALARIVSNEIERHGLEPERQLVVRGALVQAGASNAGLRGPGAAVRQQTVEVLLAIRLVDPETGEVVAAFDATGTASERGASLDFLTALVSVERNDDDWRRSPMGLAIHRAALQVAAEAAAWARAEAP